KRRFNGKIWFIIVFGIIFHAVFTLSIFDIYFRSPLVHGMTPHHINHYTNVQPPAQRLVLFVADGLRADKFFEMEDGVSRAPFMRSIVEQQGAWGVSHTRVPTETRPGHVALIAGFYEDVSAVTKGWKSNPVEFDHLFNESRHSWGYGSPDILPMFSDQVDHMASESYPPEAENFASEASELDTWVFDKIEQLFDNATKDEQLMRQIKSDKVVIFLHLLGLDTNGHAYRPTSQEYYDNIRLVDKGIQKTVKLIEDFYNDHRTAYVFTSDHGMSNKGSHGDGERANTETPIVAWGSGVRGPLSYKFQMENITRLRGKGREYLAVDSDTPSNWQLGNLMRSDVSQADIAPLMSTLIGVPCPLNSVGVLPTDYLGTDAKYTSYALYSNMLQIWEMYRLKSDTKRESSMMFSPFTKLNDAQQRLSNIKVYLDTAQYEDAQLACHELIDLCLQGLNYFQTYDRPFLMTMITLGYFGWIITLSLYVMNNYTEVGSKADREQVKQLLPTLDKISNLLIALLSLALYGYLLANESPVLYYLYCTFVIFFWGKTIPANVLPAYLFMQEYFNSATTATRDNSARSKVVNNFILLSIGAVIVMELLVVAYFDRRVLSFLYVLLALVSIKINNSVSPLQRMVWIGSCLLMSIFPSLPIDYGNATNLVCLGGVLTVVMALVAQTFGPFTSTTSTRSPTNGGMVQSSQQPKITQYILMAAIALSAWLVYTTDSALVKKTGLPYFNQITSWILLVASFVTLALLKGKHYFDHWIYLCLSLCIPFVLLSISYETLFYCFFVINLSLWMYTELKLERKDGRPTSAAALATTDTITHNDIKRAIIYVCNVV
ncbi:hypothetical protein SAMD00019534_042950, partial [Acytostelium subglobosum LB1]|uniref:hypothetical protein n=1 Tax=Acytostelium subglobosum LB1 TaxID=1410327 RepID=UPI000644C152